MAQVIQTLCDECLEAGEETAGQSYALTIEVPGAKAAPYIVDACDVHAKPVRDMLDSLARYGRRADRKTPLPRVAAAAAEQSGASRATGGAVPCPIDGCGTTAVSEAAMDSHLSKYHGTRLSEVRGEADFPCPARGCTRMLAKPQGLSAHLRTAHGWDLDRAREAVASAAAAARE